MPKIGVRKRLNSSVFIFFIGNITQIQKLDLLLITFVLLLVFVFFFLSGFSFTDTDDSQDNRGRKGTMFYSTLPFPPTHEHSDI